MNLTLRKTANLAIIEQLAAENRRILSDWRALILLRRATFALPATERRWTLLPNETSDLSPLLRQMRQRQEIKQLKDLPFLYEVTVPYARIGPLDETEALMEVHPYSALSHLSALVFHGLTDEFPRAITAMATLDTGDDLPLGTEPRDWEGIPLVEGRRLRRILGHPVTWTRVRPELFFGLAIYQPRGYSVRVTTPERTILDSLQSPVLAGGIENVLRAWMLARDIINLDRLIHLVNRFDIAILRQRAGYILEELGLVDPRIDQWQALAQRGGSSKLVAAAPYSPQFSERWSLSLNAPVHALRDEPA